MIAYAANRCEYYLQLEDDITATYDFLSAVDAYIEQQREVRKGSCLQRCAWECERKPDGIVLACVVLCACVYVYACVCV